MLLPAVSREELALEAQKIVGKIPKVLMIDDESSQNNDGLN